MGVHHASLAVLQSTLHAAKSKSNQEKVERRVHDLEEESRGIETSGGDNYFLKDPGGNPGPRLVYHFEQ